MIKQVYELSETHIHEYNSRAKIKRLNFDLELSKYDTNLLGTITYFNDSGVGSATAGWVDLIC
jgi:hypothetical protein